MRAVAFVLLLLISAAAITAHNTSAWVTEFQGAPPLSVYYPYPTAPALASQELIVVATPVNSTAFTSRTGLIRVVTQLDIHIAIGPSAVATHTDTLMLAGSTEGYVVKPGDRVSVIDASHP